MLSILVFTIHFAALYSINCAFSQSNSRSERREKEKKPSDRIEGRKVWWKSPREKSFFTFFGENIFLAKNVAPSINVGRAPYMVTSWGAPFSWYESCYQRHCLLFPKDISLFLLYSYHLDTYFWTVSLLLSLVDNCLHSQFGNYRFLLIPSTFSDLEFSTALDCIFTIIITEFITTNNSISYRPA